MNDYSELIERLRAQGGKGQGGRVKSEAADTIEALQRELVEALEDNVGLITDKTFLEIKLIRQRDKALEEAASAIRALKGRGDAANG